VGENIEMIHINVKLVENISVCFLFFLLLTTAKVGQYIMESLAFNVLGG